MKKPETTHKKNLLLVASLCLLFQTVAAGQSLEPSQLLKPLADDWPTYSGDYSSRRYSKLSQINQSTVKHLTLAWASRVTAGAGNAAGGGGGRGGRGGGGPGADHHRRRRHGRSGRRRAWR